MIRDVSDDDRSCSHEGVPAHRHAAHNRAVRAQCRVMPDQRLLDLCFPWDGTSGVDDVGEHHRRAAKDEVFQRDSFVDRHVVLDLDTRSDRHVGSDHHVLPDVAVRANPAAGMHVREVPDPGARQDLAGLVHNRRGMNLNPLVGGLACSPQPHRRPFAVERELAGMQHFQHSKRLPSVRVRLDAAFHAVQKMATFVRQRLFGRDRHYLGVRFPRDRCAVNPVHMMRVQDEFLLREIVQHRHFFVPDHDQLLLLEGVQPAHEHVSLHPAGKGQ